MSDRSTDVLNEVRQRAIKAVFGDKLGSHKALAQIDKETDKYLFEDEPEPSAT
jgi:hypothetical protein